MAEQIQQYYSIHNYVIYPTNLDIVETLLSTYAFAFIKLLYRIDNCQSIYNLCGYYQICAPNSVFGILYDKGLVEAY